MSADSAHKIDQFVSFEFFDSVGIVASEFGNILYFSNLEIIEITEGEKTSTLIEQVRGGRAAGSVVTLARSFSFDITLGRNDSADTFGKVRALLTAIANNYRIRFKILKGYNLWEQAFRTFTDLAPNVSSTFEWATVDVSAAPTYRKNFRGYGQARNTFPVIVYEGDALPVPSTANQTAGSGGGGSVETRNTVIGGINILVDVFIPGNQSNQ